MRDYLYVMLGGALGTGARFGLNIWVTERFPHRFPLGTLIINITGSFIIGFFAALTEPGGPVAAPLGLRLFFMIGLCGGYTTFSSFSLQTLTLLQERDWLWAGLNIGLSIALCLLGVWLGAASAGLVPRGARLG